MLTYEEVLALAKKNSDEQHLLCIKYRKELDRREARRLQAEHEERVEHQRLKSLEAEEERRNPRPLLISRARYQEMREEALAVKEEALAAKGSSTIKQEVPVRKTFSQPAAPRPYPERKPVAKESRPTTSFTGKAASSSLYADSKKVTEARKPISRPKVVPPSTASMNAKPEMTMQKFSQPSERVKLQRREVVTKRAAPASPSLKRKVIPSDRASPPLVRPKVVQPIPKQQLPISAPPKRSLATDSKLNSSGLTGSRFAKYGPLEDEPPLKSLKSSASSRPNRSPLQYSSKSSEAIESKARSRVNSNDKVIHPSKGSVAAPEKVRPFNSDRLRTSDRDRKRSSDHGRQRPFEQTSSKPNRPIVREIRKSRADSPPSPRRQSSDSRKKQFDLKDDIIDEDFAKKNISSIIGNLFGYDRSKDDFSDDDMEVSASRVRAEESRSARLGRLEDEREEALERQRLLRLRQKKGSR